MLKKTISALIVFTMLFAMSVPTFAADTGRRKVQITIPTELVEQLGKDGITLTQIRLNKINETSDMIIRSDIDSNVAVVEIGPNEMFHFMYLDGTRGHYLEGLWFETDKLIAAADGDGVCDVGFHNVLYNFNSKIYFNGNYKATVKWETSSDASTPSKPADPSSTPEKKIEGSLTSDPAKDVNAIFTKYFTKNTFLTADLGIGEPFEETTEVTIDLGSEKIDLAKAVFYSYNKELNSYAKIANPGASVSDTTLTVTNVGTHGTYLVISLNGVIIRLNDAK